MIGQPSAPTAALAYAQELGWHVFPVHGVVYGQCTCGSSCGSPGKHPLTANGFKDATRDPVLIRSWWSRWPSANIGVATGTVSGIVAIDIDPKNGGDQSLEAFERSTGALPRTVTALTGGGGRHLLFRHPGGTVRSRAGVRPGIDVRADGGYIVVPPSRHISGRQYAWDPEVQPGRTPILEMPRAIEELLGCPRRGPAGPAVIPAGARNDSLMRIAGSLRRQGLDRVAIAAVLRSENQLRCQPPLPDSEVEKIAASAARYSPGPGGEREEDPEPQCRPVIEVIPGQLPQVLDAAEAALLDDKGAGIFQRGGVLVRVIRTEQLTTYQRVKRKPGALIIHALEAPYLVERLTAAARWQRFDRRLGSWVDTDCPDRVAKSLMARRGDWRFPPLVGLLEAPTLRPDGSILSKPGYDEATGLLLETGGLAFPPVPGSPSRTDAETALASLLDLLGGFPFVGPSDRAAALSAILTGVVRRSLKSAPLHAFGATKMRTGKSLLADLVSLIVTGRPCAVMAYNHERSEEEKKRLLAVLLAGDPVVCIDNIDRPFGGAAISQALTQETISDRILGVSKMVTVPTNTMFLATGNGLVFEGDVTTRVVICELDAKCERPEERRFSRDLYQYVPERRGELVVAALTILRAYHMAGRPAQDLPRWGGFEEWSDWVRSAIVWLGLADPALGRRRIEDCDPVRRDLTALLECWWNRLHESTATVAEVLRASYSDQALEVALRDVAGNFRGEINTRRLGNYLQSHRGRIEGGFFIERAGDRSGAALWRVRRAMPSESAEGCVGSVGFRSLGSDEQELSLTV